MSFKRSEIALLDFQYCHGNDDSIYMKEMAYMSGSSVAPNYFVFKQPFDIRELSREGRRKNDFCRKYVNGLEWSMGSIDYCSMGDILSPLNNFKYVFVVGQTKKDFLTKYVKTTVINLENKVNLKNLKNYFTYCPIHSNTKFKYAQNNLFKLFLFIEKKYYQIHDIIIDAINY